MQKQSLTSIAVNADQKFLISTSETQRVLFDLDTLKEVSSQIGNFTEVVILENNQIVLCECIISEQSKQNYFQLVSSSREQFQNQQIIISKLNIVKSLTYFQKNNLIALTDEQKILLWDIKGRQQVATFSGHVGSTCSVSFSQNGQNIASGGQDQLVRLWNANALQNRFCQDCHTSKIEALKFSPDGLILASSCQTGQIRLWNMQSKRSLAVLANHTSRVNTLEFSQDQKFLLSCDKNSIILWNILNFKQITSVYIVKNSNTIKQVMLTKNSDIISAHKSKDGINYFYLWNKQEIIKRTEKEFNLQPSEGIDYYQFLQTEGLLAYLAKDQMRIVNFQTKKHLAFVINSIKYFTFSENQKKLATMDTKMIVSIWEDQADMQWKKQKEIFLKYLIDKEIINFKFSKDENLLYFVSQTDVLSLDLFFDQNDQGSNNWSIDKQISVVQSVNVDQNQKLIILARLEIQKDTCNIYIYDQENFNLLKTFWQCSNSIRSICLSFDCKYQSGCDDEQKIYVWDYQNENQSFNPLQIENKIKRIQFQKDFSLIMIISYSEKQQSLVISKWDLQNQLHSYLNIYNKQLSTINISPLGNLLATIARIEQEIVIHTFDKTTQLYSKRELFYIQKLKYLQNISFSPNEKNLAVSDSFGQFYILDILKKEIVQTIDQNITKSIQSINFSRNGRFLLLSSSNISFQLCFDEKYQVISTNHFYFDSEINQSFITDNGNVLFLSKERQFLKFNNSNSSQLNRLYFESKVKGVPILLQNGLVYTKEQNKIKIYDILLKKKTEEIDCIDISKIYLSSDEQLFVLTNSSQLLFVKFDDLKTHSKASKFKAHEEKIRNVVISSDRTLLASICKGNLVKLWNISNPQNPELRCTFFGDGKKHFCSFTKDSIYFSQFLKKQITVVKIELCSKAQTQLLEKNNSHLIGIQHYEISAETEGLFIVYQKQLMSRELNSSKQVKLFSSKVGIEQFAFSNDFQTFAFTGPGIIYIKQINQNQIPIQELKNDDKSFHRLSFSKDGQMLLSGGQDCKIIIWCLQKFVKVVTLENVGYSVNVVAFHPDGFHFASGTLDGAVCIYISNILGNQIKKKYNEYIKRLGKEFQIGCIKVFSQKPLLEKLNCECDNIQIKSNDQSLETIFQQKQ